MHCDIIFISDGMFKIYVFFVYVRVDWFACHFTLQFDDIFVILRYKFKLDYAY